MNTRKSQLQGTFSEVADYRSIYHLFRTKWMRVTREASSDKDTIALP